MTTALTLLFLLFLCGPAMTQDLSPDTLADQYLLEATKAMEDGDRQKALRTFRKIEALWETAERQAGLEEQLSEVLQQINAQMVRVEGGTFTMGCTPE